MLRKAAERSGRAVRQVISDFQSLADAKNWIANDSPRLDRRRFRERFDQRFTARRIRQEYVYGVLASMSTSQVTTQGGTHMARTRTGPIAPTRTAAELYGTAMVLMQFVLA
jgi:hypothetical protein